MFFCSTSSFIFISRRLCLLLFLIVSVSLSLSWPHFPTPCSPGTVASVPRQTVTRARLVPWLISYADINLRRGKRQGTSQETHLPRTRAAKEEFETYMFVLKITIDIQMKIESTLLSGFFSGKFQMQEPPRTRSYRELVNIRQV